MQHFYLIFRVLSLALLRKLQSKACREKYFFLRFGHEKKKLICFKKGSRIDA